MRSIKPLLLLPVVLTLTSNPARAQTYSILHSFGMVTNVPGFSTYAGVVRDAGGMLYGVTQGGGDFGHGAVFRVGTNGLGFTNLHSFTGSNDGHGFLNAGSLVLSGNTLYGTAQQGGLNDNGTIFALNTDGTGFTNIYSFSAPMDADASTNRDGAFPGQLTLAEGRLYGAAEYGGAYGGGTVFTLNPDGTGFTTLYSFDALNGNYPQTNNTGANPAGGLILNHGVLYGNTLLGGTYGYGVVFAIDSAGAGFTNLHSFSGDLDGSYPNTGLVLSDGMLFGTTRYGVGGVSGGGGVFRINAGGTGFTNLHIFSGATNYNYAANAPTNTDGFYPEAGLIISDGLLWGTASAGGRAGRGTVFQISTDGTLFTNLHDFTVAPANLALSRVSSLLETNLDGARPSAALLFSGGTLYGTTLTGGVGSAGGVFQLGANGSDFTNVYSFLYPDSAGPTASLIQSGGTLYGNTLASGGGGGATLFRVNANGSGYTNLYKFDDAHFDAGYGLCALASSGGSLYAALSFGISGTGAVLAVNPDGTGYTNLAALNLGFIGLSTLSDLTLAGNRLYGTTTGGGDYGAGAIFALNTDGTGFTNLHSFSYFTFSPDVGAVSADGVLYGTVSGTLFRMDTDGTGFTNFNNFSEGTNQLGLSPGLLLSGNTLYGTSGDMFSNPGVIFKVSTDGSGFSILYHFTGGDDGSAPLGGLVLSGDTLYGTAQFGQSLSNAIFLGTGTLFSIKTNGSGFRILHTFGLSSDDGALPTGGLVLSGNILYGTTQAGGETGNGVVFALTLPPPDLHIQIAGNSAVLTWNDPTSASTLQAASVLTGTYTNLTGVSSPYTNTLTAVQQYFRLIGK